MTTEENNYRYTYKYLPFKDNCIKIITESTISFTCPLKFNDPFDCNPYYQIPDISTLKRKRPDLFKIANIHRKKQHLKKITNEQMYRNLIDRFSDFRFRELSKVGIVSLSDLGLSPLMWSHYGNSHKGFVLEFRTPIKVKKTHQKLTWFDNLLSVSVKYDTARPTIQVGIEDDKSLAHKQYLTKSSDWRYEAERRVVDHIRGPGIHQYLRDKVLCSVIAGAKIEEKKLKQLTNAVNDAKKSIPDLKLFQAKLSDQEFKVEVPHHPRLGMGS